jgi:UDP-glucose 4-epimerase
VLDPASSAGSSVAAADAGVDHSRPGGSMRVLVTGGAGYVGSVSVERLVEAGHEVVVLDDLTTGHRESVPPTVSLEVGSYGDADLVERLLERARVDAILHCAARSLVAESVRDPSRYYRDNVAGGIVLLEAARQANVGRIVFSSTAAVYGVPDATPIPEDAPLRPINPYGETKRTFEGALRFYGEAYGLRSVSLRYFNVAGATERNGELHDPETHLIPNVLRAAETGVAITLFGDDYPTPDGTCIRDYIHVGDLADAHLTALEATARDDPRTDAALVCNLGIGAGFSVREVVDAATAVVGRSIPETIGPRRAGDPPVLVAAADRAREVLGWTAARPTLDEMIGSAWAWRRAHLDADGARIA